MHGIVDCRSHLKFINVKKSFNFTYFATNGKYRKLLVTYFKLLATLYYIYSTLSTIYSRKGG